jgi:hypothetical protein
MLADAISQLQQPWAVTYDYAVVAHGLYNSHRRMSYALGYTANSRYEGREALFLSDRLVLPQEWQSSTPVVLSAERSESPLYGRMECC